MNRLFVAFKPAGVSSNGFLSKIKRRYGVKKAGFSGTLDPFASGCLIIAFGGFTKLFNYLDKSPKTYRATIWLGADSDSGDTENIKSVETVSKLATEMIQNAVLKLTGEVVYTPPKFSAKKIAGKRAYELARSGADFELNKSKMQIFSAKIVNYNHPFLSVELSVSEGAYIRSWAQLLAGILGVRATLSALERLSEGKFKYENEKPLNPLDFLNIKRNIFRGDTGDLKDGKPLKIGDFESWQDGVYAIINDGELAIIEILDGEIKYRLNRIEIC